MLSLILAYGLVKTAKDAKSAKVNDTLIDV